MRSNAQIRNSLYNIEISIQRLHCEKEVLRIEVGSDAAELMEQVIELAQDKHYNMDMELMRREVSNAD